MTTYDMSGAMRGPIAYGPAVTRSGEVVPRITARICHMPLGDHVETSLPNSWDRRWQEQLNDAGSGSLKLAMDDPGLTILSEGDLIRLEDAGVAAFTFIARKIDMQTIAIGEEAEEVAEISGPGHIAILADGLVYPSRGPDVQPFEEDRLFSWPAVDFDDSGWGTAAGLVTQSPGLLLFADAGSGILDTSGGENGSYWETMLPGWPDRTAWWIWARGLADAREWAPAGTCYFRHEFTVPAGVSLMQYYCCFDAAGDLYIDGQKMASSVYGTEPDKVNIYTDRLLITPGVHTVAVACTNDVDPEADEIHNPGGILFAAYPIDQAGRFTGDPFVHTDNTWKIVAYPAEPPGMTPGEVIRHVIEEAQARGCYPTITLGFTDQTDSDGVPWTRTTQISTKVGTDVWTFLRELTDTYVDLWMEPANWRLHAWVKGGRGIARDLTLHAPTDATDPYSGNLRRLSHTVVS